MVKQVRPAFSNTKSIPSKGASEPTWRRPSWRCSSVLATTTRNGRPSMVTVARPKPSAHAGSVPAVVATVVEVDAMVAAVTSPEPAPEPAPEPEDSAGTAGAVVSAPSTTSPPATVVSEPGAAVASEPGGATVAAGTVAV